MWLGEALLCLVVLILSLAILFAAHWLPLFFSVRRKAVNFGIKELFGGKDALTFDEIDIQWDGKILAELVRGFFLGNFEKGNKTNLRLYSNSAFSDKLQAEPPQPVDRIYMTVALNVYCGALFNKVSDAKISFDFDSGRDKEICREIMEKTRWDELSQIPLEHFNRTEHPDLSYLSIYLKNLVIDRVTFKKWLLRNKNIFLPQRWYERQNHT